MADRVSWAAVNKYQADPLCDGDEDDRRWKQAVKEAKEENEKKSSYSGRRDRRRSPVRISCNISILLWISKMVRGDISSI